MVAKASMLGYAQLVLSKVSFDLGLFEKRASEIHPNARAGRDTRSPAMVPRHVYWPVATDGNLSLLSVRHRTGNDRVER